MAATNQNELIQRISSSIHNIDETAEVYLFGSRARGESHSSSDWDLLILVDDEKVTNGVEDKFRNQLFEIELEIGQIISLLIYPKTDWNTKLSITPLYKNISKEGVRI